MIDHPYLSIIVPTYNCESFLEEGLESVLSQLSADGELIVIDDGSSDATALRLSAYENKQENIRIQYREHRGASAARNAGLDLARGEYVAFMDCDDCLQEGFLTKSRPLLDRQLDLYIFGIERIFMDGTSEFWTVSDHFYETISDFADEYIRNHHLLIYSNCNKFYRRDIIQRLALRFEEDIDFGEDRLFNYRYLTGCSNVMTCEILMLRYLQRHAESMSGKPIPDYYAKVMRLHEAKMNCFLSLSHGTTAQERADFVRYDRDTETRLAAERA